MVGADPALGADDLILSYFAVRHASFPDRVAAAAGAGFAGIGMYLPWYDELRASGLRDADLQAVLDEHGQRIVEFEAIRGWSGTDGPDRTCRARLETAARMVDAFGPPHHVQVVGPYDGEYDAAVEAFADLCDRLAALGTRASVEYLPEMTNIPDAAAAWQLTQDAGRDNAGLCVDIWHHTRRGESAAELARVPGERVFAVQFNDGLLARTRSDYRLECMSDRRVPGEGEFDVDGFVRTLDSMGVDVPYSVEVISLDLDRLPTAEVAGRIADATRAVFARVR